MRKRKGKIKYGDEPVGNLHIVADFLPPPEALVLKKEVVKVTLSLSKDSLQFFKKQASKRHIPYQQMIRALVDSYARQHGPRP